VGVEEFWMQNGVISGNALAVVEVEANV